MLNSNIKINMFSMITLDFLRIIFELIKMVRLWKWDYLETPDRNYHRLHFLLLLVYLELVLQLFVCWCLPVNTCLVCISIIHENLFFFFSFSLSHTNHIREFEEIIQTFFFFFFSFSSRSNTTITSDKSE